MNEPQVWTMIVGTIAALFTLIGLTTSWFTRLITTQFEALRNEMNAKFETVDTKLTHLDRDVQALTKKVFHQPE